MDDLRKAEQLMRCILPEIERPFNVLDASEIDDIPSYANNLGWTTRVADVLLRQDLERLGRWEGRRGFVCVVNTARIRSGFRFVCGIVLHELAHHIDGLTDPESEALMALPFAPRLSRDHIAKVAETKIEVAEVVCASDIPEDVPLWTGHELPFVRAAAHLAYRAGRLVESIRPWHLRSVSPYHAFGSEEAALEACSEELDSDISLVELLRTPPPQRLVDYWDALTR